jgi:hypothetical protein
MLPSMITRLCFFAFLSFVGGAPYTKVRHSVEITVITHHKVVTVDNHTQGLGEGLVNGEAWSRY